MSDLLADKIHINSTQTKLNCVSVKIGLRIYHQHLISLHMGIVNSGATPAQAVGAGQYCESQLLKGTRLSTLAHASNEYEFKKNWSSPRECFCASVIHTKVVENSDT